MCSLTTDLAQEILQLINESKGYNYDIVQFWHVPWILCMTPAHFIPDFGWAIYKSEKVLASSYYSDQLPI